MHSAANRLIIACIILVVVAGSVTTCRRAGQWLVKQDTPLHADAMVMLMGGVAPDRILQVVDQYKAGLAGRLIIVQENMGAYRELEKRGAGIISSTEQATNAAVTLGIPADSILILPGDARSTQTEALIIGEYLKNNPSIDTLSLITSADHSRRTYLIFNKVFRKAGLEVVVLSNPSKYSSFNPKSWWKRKEDAQAVVMEWVKMVNFWLIDKSKF